MTTPTQTQRTGYQLNNRELNPTLFHAGHGFDKQTSEDPDTNSSQPLFPTAYLPPIIWKDEAYNKIHTFSYWMGDAHVYSNRNAP